MNKILLAKLQDARWARRAADLPSKADERLLRMTGERLHGPGIYRLTQRVPWRSDDYVVVEPDGTAIVTRFIYRDDSGKLVEVPKVTRYDGFFASKLKVGRTCHDTDT